MNRRVRGTECGPGRPAVEVLVDEAIAQAGKRHPLRTPLAQANPMSPAVAAKPNGARWRRRRTGRRIARAGAAKRSLRRLGFVLIERLLQLAALIRDSSESDQRLTAKSIELAIVAGNRRDLAGDRIGACLQGL